MYSRLFSGQRLPRSYFNTCSSLHIDDKLGLPAGELLTLLFTDLSQSSHHLCKIFHDHDIVKFVVSKRWSAKIQTSMRFRSRLSIFAYCWSLFYRKEPRFLSALSNSSHISYKWRVKCINPYFSYILTTYTGAVRLSYWIIFDVCFQINWRNQLLS